MKPLIKSFDSIRIHDLDSVGGKNSSLGEMYSNLSVKGVVVPNGFAITAEGFLRFLVHNDLQKPLQKLMSHLNRTDYSNLHEIGLAARSLLWAAELPDYLRKTVVESYRQLGEGKPIAVAVRSSATAEDLPQASFAGQHESYLNVSGDSAVLEAVHKCYRSLYTDRAIKYREDNGFPHDKVFLSVGVQQMVRSDKAASGVIFTLEPESGFRDIIHISGVWGLGENIVQGTVTPDEFFVFKPTLLSGAFPIIRRKLGEKEQTMVYGTDDKSPVLNLITEPAKRKQFVLNDEEIIRLAHWSSIIESHYGKPMDIEWGKDGLTNELFILQARPETVHSRKDPLVMREYRLEKTGKILATGQAIGARVATGVARILNAPDDAESLMPGEILVTDLTSPDWDPILKRAAAIITNKGGRTSHASIVARELGVPAVVGCGDATATVINGQVITVSCCEGELGNVYEGRLPFVEKALDMSQMKMPTRTKAMLITGDPEKAFKLSFYPNDGVGLMRMEFIITHFIKVHPMALVHFDKLTDSNDRNQIDAITHLYPDKTRFFVDQLAQGIATIAAAFYPKEVIVRMTDFKTNEYANLLGGATFEPAEENPMIGFRGASRYYHPAYSEGFRLECEAIREVRGRMGLVNVKVMIPFCRTLGEAARVLETMKSFGLERGANGLEVYVMAEIPSNVVMAEEFARIFDGFSIGSNDLTQLTLGIDRDSSMVSELFDEQDEAPKRMMATMIQKAKQAGSRIGLCGQAPSDFPEFARFLVGQGIDSISFNEDALLKGIENIVQAEGAEA